MKWYCIITKAVGMRRNRIEFGHPTMTFFQSDPKREREDARYYTGDGRADRLRRAAGIFRGFACKEAFRITSQVHVSKRNFPQRPYAIEAKGILMGDQHAAEGLKLVAKINKHMTGAHHRCKWAAIYKLLRSLGICILRQAEVDGVIWHLPAEFSRREDLARVYIDAAGMGRKMKRSMPLRRKW